MKYFVIITVNLNVYIAHCWKCTIRFQVKTPKLFLCIMIICRLLSYILNVNMQATELYSQCLYAGYWVIFSMFICRLLSYILNFQKMPPREFWANQFLRNCRNQFRFKILICLFWVFWRCFFNSMFSNFFINFLCHETLLIVAKNQTTKSTAWLSKCGLKKIFWCNFYWFYFDLFAKTCLMIVKENSQNLRILPSTVLKILQKTQNNLDKSLNLQLRLSLDLKMHLIFTISLKWI